jgi:hypothetical protein
MDSRHGSFPNIIKSLTDATNEFGDGVRLTTGPRSARRDYPVSYRASQSPRYA